MTSEEFKEGLIRLEGDLAEAREVLERAERRVEDLLADLEEED
jgi:hypothetical protein